MDRLNGVNLPKQSKEAFHHQKTRFTMIEVEQFINKKLDLATESIKASLEERLSSIVKQQTEVV